MKMSKIQRLWAIIAISMCFFVLEITMGFKNRSLALVADGLHVLYDVIGFGVALIAAYVDGSPSGRKGIPHGYQRASLLGAFFNGVFLLALAVNIFLQSIERFIEVQRVENPKLILIVGAIGLGLNMFSATLAHNHGDNEHAFDTNTESPTTSQNSRPSDKFQSRESRSNQEAVTFDSPGSPSRAATAKPARDLGMMGVALHLFADAINNIGVMISAVVIWFGHGQGRYYADPSVSLFIAFSIFASAFPLTKNAGLSLLESAPREVELEVAARDIISLPDVEALNDLRIWSLAQMQPKRSQIATVHISTRNNSLRDFMETARRIQECLQSWGVECITIQPQLSQPTLPTSWPPGWELRQEDESERRPSFMPQSRSLPSRRQSARAYSHLPDS